MNKKMIFVAAFLVGALSACSSTWNGVKDDVQRNAERTESGLETGWDKTKNAVGKGMNRVGEGLSNTGEKLQTPSESQM